MSRRTTLSLSIVTLAGLAGTVVALTGLVRGAGAADPIAPGAGRTAVADVVALLNAAPRKRLIEAENLTRKQAIEKYADAEQTKLGEMRKLVMTLADNDLSRRKLETDYAREKVLAEFDLKAKVGDAEAAYSGALEMLYEEVKSATRQIAEEMGFALVINVVNDRLDLRDSPGGFVANVAARPVLYASSALDITSFVKARLEAARPPSPGPSPMPVPGPISRPPAPSPSMPPAPSPSSLPPPMPSSPVVPAPAMR